ncbi:hypothetical protein ACJIZ3_024080 [Penstemon smallii]|uniref:C2H2-type domain-containing protein n=1 Tax=Penstemon smallii TaxID=265156 RepID=A0ABD3TQV3_9LAMI
MNIDDFANILGRTRCYRCAFCKRGFSNAQALGGHMNIHRKDRAKLKEFSGENLLCLDITKNIDCEEISDSGEKILKCPKVDDVLQEANHGHVDLELRLGPEPFDAKTEQKSQNRDV